MQRTITGIFLLLCLVAPFLATYCWLQCQKVVVKKEIKRRIIAGMDKDALVLLKFTKEASQTELRWEHAKEFEFDGQMYDVVEIAVKGDTVYYHCWLDESETALNKRLTALVAGALENDPSKKGNQERLANFYKSLYHTITPLYMVPLPGYRAKQEACPYLFHRYFVSFSPPSPPPEMVEAAVSQVIISKV